MKTKKQKHYHAKAQVAKAMAHPSRMLILDELQKGELCVCDLTELVEADQSTVSKHLAILKNVGLISVRKEGTKSLYKLNCPCLTDFFACIESVLLAHVASQIESLADTDVL